MLGRHAPFQPTGVSARQYGRRGAPAEFMATRLSSGVLRVETNPATLLAPSANTASGAATKNSFSDLGSDDFLKLLIMQLRNQDPLEPLDNNEMLQQIASIRDIELNTTLTDSLRSVAGQQNFASASSLIGQYVTSASNDGSARQAGIVVAVRFTDAGQAVLRLADGSELPMDKVRTIESPIRVAETLIGKGVVGLDRRDPTRQEVVEGVVANVRKGDQGDIVLELESGQDLRFRDVVGVSAAELV